jgi:hypothetical protein
MVVATAVVAVMSVQPTSEKVTVSQSARAWVATKAATSEERSSVSFGVSLALRLVRERRC